MLGAKSQETIKKENVAKAFLDGLLIELEIVDMISGDLVWTKEDRTGNKFRDINKWIQILPYLKKINVITADDTSIRTLQNIAERFDRHVRLYLRRLKNLQGESAYLIIDCISNINRLYSMISALKNESDTKREERHDEKS